MKEVAAMARTAGIPSYRHYKRTGQALVTIAGQDHYLGRYNSPESKNEYDRLLAEWLANGRHAPQQRINAVPLTIAELIDRYWTFAQVYHVKNGKPTSEVRNLKIAFRPLRRLYGHTPAACFGPLALEVVRDALIELDGRQHSRSYVNGMMERVRRVFRWAVSKELVPLSLVHGMDEVKGLRPGKSAARDTARIRPVADHLVDAIQDHVSRQVWAMVELMRITGMRAGEVTIMRTGDIDGHERIVALGPQAQKAINPFLRPNLQEYIFSPIDADRERRDDLHRRRKTPLSCGNKPGSNRRRRPKIKPGDHYSVDALRRAIQRGSDLAFPVPDELANAPEGETPDQQKTRLAKVKAWQHEHRWHPHQLRHSAATRLRRQYGIEAARVVLGHHSAAVTELYAEADRKKALQVAAEVG
jgi:integrase